MTLPLLSMKLLSIARNGPKVPDTFTGPYIYMLVGILAFVTIFISVVQLLAFKDWYVKDSRKQVMMLRLCMFVSSVCVMALLFVIVLLTAEEVGAYDIVEVYVFLLSWIGYPVVYVLLTVLPTYFQPWSVDLMFGPLDVFCKGIFAVWVIHKTYVF